MSQTVFSGKGSVSLSAVAETAGGDILVADARTQQVQKIAAGKMTVIAGHKVSHALPTADGKGPQVRARTQASNARASMISPVSLWASNQHHFLHYGVYGVLQATFKLPAALVADADLNIYVADSLDHKIRRVSRRTNTVATLAGSSRAGFADGTGTRARFHQPTSLALWRQVLLVADAANHAIRAIHLPTATVTLLAGSPDGESGRTDGEASRSRFHLPSAVAVHGDMALVLEPQVHRVRSISLRANTTRTLYSRQTEARWVGLAYFFQTPPHGARAWHAGAKAGGVFVSDSTGCLIRALEIEAACDGRPLSHVQLDACGVCGGNNSCVDCGGRPHGGRVRDVCGICGGDGTGCPEMDLIRVEGGQVPLPCSDFLRTR